MDKSEEIGDMSETTKSIRERKIEDRRVNVEELKWANMKKRV